MCVDLLGLSCFHLFLPNVLNVLQECMVGLVAPVYGAPQTDASPATLRRLKSDFGWDRQPSAGVLVNPFWACYRPTSKKGLAGLDKDQEGMWNHRPQKLTVAYRKWIVSTTTAAARGSGGEDHDLRVCAHSRLALTCLCLALLPGLVVQIDAISDWDEWRLAGYDGLPAPFTFHESSLHLASDFDWVTKKWLNVEKARTAEPGTALVFDQDKPMEAVDQLERITLIKEKAAKVKKAPSKAAHKTAE
jgi:hypothetical protein